jgi:UDP-N-acetyl-D-galactosamine dehydrogenase
VGGHCIGVDPYYLAHCAESLGHDPQVILSGRRINDGMGAYLAARLMTRMGDQPGRILVLGFTFKENISDIRNTKVADMVQSLKTAGHEVDIYDPHAHADDVAAHYGLTLLDRSPEVAHPYDAVILSVCHSKLIEQGCPAFSRLVKPGCILYDIHGVWKDIPHADTYEYLTL